MYNRIVSVVFACIMSCWGLTTSNACPLATHLTLLLCPLESLLEIQEYGTALQEGQLSGLRFLASHFLWNLSVLIPSSSGHITSSLVPLRLADSISPPFTNGSLWSSFPGFLLFGSQLNPVSSERRSLGNSWVVSSYSFTSLYVFLQYYTSKYKYLVLLFIVY